MDFILNIIAKTKAWFVALFIQVALFFDKIEVDWIDKVLQLTEAIKKALDNKFVKIALAFGKVDNVVIEKAAQYLPDIKERLKFLKVQWVTCDDEEEPLKKIECFVTSLANATLPPKQRNEALFQIALTILEKMGIKIKGAFFSKQLSVETAYNVLKKKKGK